MTKTAEQILGPITFEYWESHSPHLAEGEYIRKEDALKAINELLSQFKTPPALSEEKIDERADKYIEDTYKTFPSVKHLRVKTTSKYAFIYGFKQALSYPSVKNDAVEELKKERDEMIKAFEMIKQMTSKVEIRTVINKVLYPNKLKS